MINLRNEFGLRVKMHLEEEYFIWLTTVSSDMTPQPRPVWFIWDDNTFLIFSQPEAYKVSHIQQHPNVCLHFNTDNKADENVIIFTGKAKIDKNVRPAHKVMAYLLKYKTGIEELNMTPEDFSKKYSTAIRVEPVKLRGW